MSTPNVCFFVHLNVTGYWISTFCFFWTVSLLFDFIERPEPPRLIDATYPTKMRWYKTLARILLMLSVIDFALAAPVVVQEREVRVSVVDAAKDGTTSPLPRRDPSDTSEWLANAADRTNVPPVTRSSERSDSGHWREHNPRPRTDSNDSPEPSNPAPPIDPHANNPPSPSPAQGQGPIDRFKSTHDTPPPGPGGSAQIASSPDRSPSFGSWLPADSHSGSTSSWSAGESWQSWSSTAESHSPSLGEVDQPPPAPPSTRPHPPPGAELSDKDSMKKAAMILMAMSKQGFRPRTYGSGAVDAAKGGVAGNH